MPSGESGATKKTDSVSFGQGAQVTRRHNGESL